MQATAPIIVLDSGLGGLTVVKALRQRLPGEEIVYFGDMARLPYGSKTAATVTGFVRQIIRYLLPLDPKHVVIACNTATALALPEIRKDFPGLPISGVIEPGAKAAAIAAGSKEFPVIGVIATEATVRSKAYEREIHRRRNRAYLMTLPTPLLVPIIEDGRKEDDPLVKLALKQYFKPMLKRGMEVLVLGCTHYPIIKNAIQEMVGPDVRVIDSAQMCAEDVERRLAGSGLLSPRTGTARLRCFVTDDPPRFARLGSRFLGEEIPAPALVPPDDLYGPAEVAVTVRSAAG